MAPETKTCSHCGAQAEVGDDGIPLGWSMATERKRVVFQCSRCVRDNIRAIEGKLPEEYWEY